MMKKFSQLGRAFMLPIAILPAAGLLLGLGGALTNPATIAQFPILDQYWLQIILQIMNAAGGAIFSNLPLIFTIGLAVGLANGDRGTAGLAGGVAYLVYRATLDILSTLFLEEGVYLDTGVVASIALGVTVAYLHNNYRKIELPRFLGFFGGSRFVPIVSSFAAIFVAGLFFLVWPVFQGWLVSAGEWIASLGSIGTFFYGFLLRLTGAVGLHHTVYPLFWYTELGGVEQVAGQAIAGGQNIFFAQLADPNHTGLFTYGTRFFSGRFATMMFGLPAASLAMLHSLPKERQKENRGLYISNAFTSFLTGITEPIEFSFLFSAPLLYVLHAFLDGVSFYVADILSVRIGNTFSGGFIDFMLFGPLQGNDATNWIRVIPVGIIWAIVYYVIFRYAINKFNIMIPGKEEVVEGVGAEGAGVGVGGAGAVQSGGTLHDEAVQIIAALGGEDNISTVTACATRLRTTVNDPALVDKNTLKALGATAVLEVGGGGVQAIYGGKSDLYSQEINQIMGTED